MEPSTDAPGAQPSRAPQLGGAVMAAGGVVALAGSLLGWARLNYPGQNGGVLSATLGHSRVALYLGAFMIVGGIVIMVARTRSTRQAWAVVSLMAGLVVAGFAAYDLVTERNRAIASLVASTARGSRLPPPLVAAFIRGEVATGVIRFRFSIGIYLALAAAVLALAAAVTLALATRRRRRPSPAAEASSGAPA